MAKQILSDLEVLENICRMKAKKPNCTRQDIFKAAKVGYTRFNKMVAEGLIALPDPAKSGSAWRRGNFNFG